MLRAILALIFLGMVGSALFSKDENQAPTPLSEKEVAAQEARRVEDARRQAVINAARSIKSNLRDPDSLKFQTIVANDDASIMCFAYRARNGFGGMNLEHATIVDNTIYKTSKVWNKHCAKKDLHDLTRAGSYL